MECRIRKAGIDDEAAMLRILAYWNMHHIPSAEMPELDIEHTFVATCSGNIVGLSGYRILDASRGKTTLLAIDPAFRGRGIGRQLQDARLHAMHTAGVHTVISNCDDLRTINWYRKHYGYRETGKIPKQHSFGLASVDHWTTLQMDLDAWIRDGEATGAARRRHIDAHHPPPLGAYTPLIINACLTGIVPTRALNPYVPVTVDAIIADAVRVYEAGASIVHLHARDEAGTPTCDARIYEKILAGIRRECSDLICCVSTSGRQVSDIGQRTGVLRLGGEAKPDMASLTLGSVNFTSGPSVNAIETVEYLAWCMRDNGIKPELEVFDTGMINLALYLQRHGVIEGTGYYNLMLGNLNTAPATLHSLSVLTRSLPADSIWSAAGIGRFQLPMNTVAIAAGGHVRVGIEDSMFYDHEETRPASNEELVKRVVRLCGELQRPVATPGQARNLLGLEGKAPS